MSAEGTDSPQNVRTSLRASDRDLIYGLYKELQKIAPPTLQKKHTVKK